MCNLCLWNNQNIAKIAGSKIGTVDENQWGTQSMTKCGSSNTSTGSSPLSIPQLSRNTCPSAPSVGRFRGDGSKSIQS
jgi:hypothetical protein